eukprot:1088152-Pyramimonas_sp.AAC.1
MSTFVRKQYSASQLAFLNTHHDLGPSYFGHKGSKSRIDYFLGPKELLHTDILMTMYWHAQRRLQALTHMIDHVPMFLQFRVPSPSPRMQQQGCTWDWGALAASLQK